jgi:hypothetical protein
MCTFSLGGKQWNLQKGSSCMSIRPVIKVLSWTIFSLYHFKKVLYSRCCKGWPVEVGNCTFVSGSRNWWLWACTNNSQQLPNLVGIAHYQYLPCNIYIFVQNKVVHFARIYIAWVDIFAEHIYLVIFMYSRKTKQFVLREYIAK